MLNVVRLGNFATDGTPDTARTKPLSVNVQTGVLEGTIRDDGLDKTTFGRNGERPESLDYIALISST